MIRGAYCPTCWMPVFHWETHLKSDIHKENTEKAEKGYVYCDWCGEERPPDHRCYSIPASEMDVPETEWGP